MSIKNTPSISSLIFLIIILCFPQTALSQNLPTPTPDCVGSYDQNGKYYPRGSRYYSVYGGKTYKCVACGGCVPVDNGNKSGGSASIPMGGYGSPEAFAAQMMGALLGSLFQSILAPSPQPDTSYQQQLMQQKIEKQKQEALKKQAIERWKKLQEEEEARLAEEEARKRQRGRELLAKMGRTGGGTLKPFGWETSTLTPQPIGTGTYDTSSYTSWQRMLCAAYFSSKALAATRSGNSEEAVFMNRQADRVAAGGMTEAKCELPSLQQLADVQRQNIRMNNRMADMVKLLPVVQEKVKSLQQIEVKLHRAKEQKKEAEEKLKEAEIKIREAGTRAESARTQEEKSEADDLLQQALALQQEAEAQVEEAKQAEQEYAELKEKEIQELKGMQKKITAASSGQ